MHLKKACTFVSTFSVDLQRGFPQTSPEPNGRGYPWSQRGHMHVVPFCLFPGITTWLLVPLNVVLYGKTLSSLLRHGCENCFPWQTKVPALILLTTTWLHVPKYVVHHKILVNPSCGLLGSHLFPSSKILLPRAPLTRFQVSSTKSFYVVHTRGLKIYIWSSNYHISMTFP